MHAELRWIDGLTFAAKGATNHWVVLDTRKEIGGHDGASSPMEMVLFGLMGCSAFDVVSILKKMRMEPRDFRVYVEAERASEHPKVFTKIHLKYVFYGDELKKENLERAVSLSQEKYCSVAGMLKQAVEITYEIVVNPQE
ncbi:MAG: OsmC family protein [Firmicutes bacterium]|nr:OsmC family protein [Bacillota bacterium]